MGRISEKTIERIIQNNDIVDVITEFVPLKKAGRNYMGVCPFHNDKGPSLSVSQEKQLYHCFGCGASGNVLGFIMKLRNLEFLDAIKYLGDKAGIKLDNEPEDPRTKFENDLKESLYKINIEAARFYFNNLFKENEALNYFRNRSLDDKTLKKFGLGYSPNSWDSLLKYLRSKGYNEELILKAGLILKKTKGTGYYDRFRNRVMFPVFDIKGRVIGFGGRVLDDSKPKYLNSPETPVFLKGTNLYGLNFIIKSGLPENIIIVEGYMDCISLHQHGINNAVASLGTAMTNEQAKLIKRYTRDVYICYDADAAGKTATLRGLDILTAVGCNVKVINIPRGKDPDEFIRINGVEAFKKLIEDAVPIIDYRIQRAREGKNLKDPRDKSDFINEVSNILSTMKNEIEIQVYATKVFDETGINISSILTEIDKLKNNDDNNKNNNLNKRNNNKSGNIYILEPAYKKAERWLLRLSLIDQSYYDYIKSRLLPQEFISSSYSTAAHYIFERLDRHENINPQDLLLKYTNQEDIDDISQIFYDKKLPEDTFKLIDDFIKNIKGLNIEAKINELTLEIKKCENENDINKSAILSQELILLRKQLNLL